MFNYKIKFTKKPNAGEITDKAAFDMIDDYWGGYLIMGKL